MWNRFKEKVKSACSWIANIVEFCVDVFLEFALWEMAYSFFSAIFEAIGEFFSGIDIDIS